jgi:uncharacterized repeat protein (TIGR01451 family)
VEGSDSHSLRIEADLILSKQCHQVTAGVEDQLVYTIVVENLGPSDARDVVVSDALPAGLSDATWALDGVDQGAWTGSADLGTLAAGDTAAIEIYADVASWVTSLANSATVTSSTADPDTGDNGDACTNGVETEADLVLSKQCHPVTAGVEDQLVYTIVVENLGPSDVRDVVVSDALPAGLSDATWTLDGVDQGAWTGSADLGTLAAGDTAAIEIYADVASWVTSLANSATVTSSTADPDTGDNGDACTNGVETEADLEITKESSPDPVVAGEELVYTITVTNRGPSDARGVVVTETYDPWFIFGSATPAPDPGTDNVWSLGTIPAGASVVIEITGTVDPATPEGTQLMNTVVVDSDTQDDDEDDNSDVEETDVITRADLEITKESSPDPVVAGEELTYTITVTNHGPSDAQNVVVTETYDPWFHFESANPEPDPGTDNVWTLGTVPAGASVVIEITGTVDPAGGEPLENWVRCSTSTTDPDQENNVDCEVTALVGLQIHKVGSTAYAQAGDTVDYTIAVTNPTSSELHNVRVVDELLGIDVVIPLLAPYSTWVYTVAYTLTLEHVPELLNTSRAELRFGEQQLVVEDTWVVQVGYISGLSLSKATYDEAGNYISSAQEGDTVIYRFVLLNTGNVPFFGVEMVDDELGHIPGPVSGDVNADGVLDPGEEWVYEYRYVVTAADVERGVIENLATASGQDPWGKGVQASAVHSLATAVIAGGLGELECEAKVVITEVAWAGTPASPDHEWIELLNLGRTPVDITGWTLRWKPKHPQSPDEDYWRVVELAGVIERCEVSPCYRDFAPWWTDFLIHSRETSSMVWVEFTSSEELARREHGYFLLERGTDEVVKDCPADLIYPAHLELPDEGAVIQLLSPAGEIVDTVNTLGGDGWPGGDAALPATMERVSPLAPDAPEGWDTNLGLKAFGQAADGSELLATPAGENEGVLDWEAALDLPPYLAPVPLERVVRLTFPVEPEQRVRGWPRMSLTKVGEGQVSGGVPSWWLGDLFTVELNPGQLSPGEYRLWVVLSAGRVALIWFIVD